MADKWGKVAGAKRGQDEAKDAAPQLQRGPSDQTAVLLDDIDVAKLEIGPELKAGANGDKYMEIKYEGKRLAIRFNVIPEYTRSPFKAGPAMKDGKQIGKAWGMVVEITPEQYDKWIAVEDKLIKTLKKRRNELMDHVLKTDRSNKKIPKTEADFEQDFNTILKPANPEKGYKATMRLAVQHEAKDPDSGKPKRMPSILLTKLKGPSQWTKPRPGTIEDLMANIAISPMASVSRGIYFGGTGWGLKLSLDEAYIFTNLAGNQGPVQDVSGMTVVPDSDDEDEATKRLKNNEETSVRPFLPDASGDGFDAGNGAGVTAAGVTAAGEVEDDDDE